MMNIAYFAQKLVEKLNGRMFAADPKQILIFTAKQIMVVSHMEFFPNRYQHVVMCCFTQVMIPQFSRRWL